jgi:hypothetical protein
MTDYAAVLIAEYPDAEWALDGDDYSGLTWLSDSPKPTKAALDKLWTKVQRDLAIAAVRAARADLYANETDGIFFQAMRDEGDVTLDDWKAAVQAVKDAHPWPA